MVRYGIRFIAVVLLSCGILIWMVTLIGQQSNNELVSFIAEFDDQTDIYLYDPLRGDLFNITYTAFPEWSYDWSDERTLSYSASVTRDQVADRLFIMPRIGNATQLDLPQILYSFGNVWSPDGTTLAYFSSQPRNYSDIYTISFPGLEISNLTLTDTLSETNPQWSPQGDRLLYLMDGNLYLYDMQSAESELLLDSRQSIESPIWSPDGEWIAFYEIRFVNGSNVRFVYILRVDEGRVQPLNLDFSLNGSPVTWSPDSQQIALIADNTTLVIYDLLYDRIQEIPGENRRSAPQWSPEGRWIAFIETRQLHTYDVTSGDIHQLDREGLVKPPLIWRP